MFTLSKDFKHGHKLWSMWCAAAVVLVSGLEVGSQMGLSIAPLWREIIDEATYPKIVAGLTTLGMVARFIKQNCIAVKENLNVEESDSPVA